MELVDKDHVCAEFKSYIKERFGTGVKAAEHYKTYSSYISGITRGTMAPSNQMLADIGYERVRGFKRIDPE